MDQVEPLQDYMDKDEFLLSCRRIAVELGEESDMAGSRLQMAGMGTGGPAFRFEDPFLVILAEPEGAMEVTRKAQPDGPNHLRVENPTTMVMPNGECIRHHGEHCYLVPRVKSLMAGIYKSDLIKAKTQEEAKQALIGLGLSFVWFGMKTGDLVFGPNVQSSDQTAVAITPDMEWFPWGKHVAENPITEGKGEILETMLLDMVAAKMGPS